MDEENRTMVALLKSVKLEGFRIADVGCGTGNILRVLQSRFPEGHWNIVCIDQSNDMLLKINPSEKISTLVADALSLPLDASSFDLVFCVGVSDYMKNGTPLVLELQRICHNDGYLFMTFVRPAFWNFVRNVYGKRIYSSRLAAIEQLVASLKLDIVGRAETRLQYQMLLRNKQGTEFHRKER